MKRIILLVYLLSLFSATRVTAQDEPKPKPEKLTKQDKELLASANIFYKENNFLRALAIYKVLAESYPNNSDLVYKAGICFLYKTDEKESAIEFIESAAKLNPKLEDLEFNLGRAYHANYKFQEAIQHFDEYIRENPPVVKRNLAEHYIEFCRNGEIITPKQQNMIIENIGPPINSENSEYVPVVSADESILIFTYKGERSTGGMMDGKFNPSSDGEYYEDVFVSYKIGEKWTEPQSIGENINTKGHDASIALSTDGQSLFIFKSTPEDKGDIYMSQLDGETWSTPMNLGPNVNTKFWEGSVSMSADEQTLYFASERPGGLGGRDIYISERQQSGQWGPALNLGPAVNTPYDDDAPFIHPDGVTLFFSSKGHNSMGGYDIFYSSNKTGEWAEPVNMGAPINTTDDDLYYVLNPDGETGYYSSNRKEGYGQQDIYVITPGLTGTKPILALAVGKVLLDSKPAAATITVIDADNGATKGNYRSNSTTGKYMVALPPGKSYKLAIEVAGKQPHYEYIDVKSLETYVQLQQDIQVYSEEYIRANKVDPSASDNLQARLNEQLKKYKAESNPEIYEAHTFEELLKKRGDLKKDSVTFNVDAGTYETASDFDPSKFSDLGVFETVKTPKDYTNYYVKGFNTLVSAEEFRQKLISRDPELAKVAEITVNDKGNVKLMPDYFSAYYTRKDYTVRTEPKLIKTKSNPELEERKENAKLMDEYGDKKIEGLSYKLELASVDKAADFKLQKMSKYGKIESKKTPDGKIHYTIGNFKTLREVNDFKASLIQKEPETERSLVTVFYLNELKPAKEFFKDPAMKEKINKTTAPALVKEKPVKTPPVIEPAKEVVKNTPEEPTPCEPETPHDFSAFAGQSLNNPFVYEKFIKSASTMCREGLVFKVQVGAYRQPQNFVPTKLKTLGLNIVNNDPIGDGISRFTMGEFKTLKDTEILRQKAIGLGTKDAWITAVYNGKRYTLEELIPLNFFNKAIN